MSCLHKCFDLYYQEIFCQLIKIFRIGICSGKSAHGFIFILFFNKLTPIYIYLNAFLLAMTHESAISIFPIRKYEWFSVKGGSLIWKKARCLTDSHNRYGGGWGQIYLTFLHLPTCQWWAGDRRYANSSPLTRAFRINSWHQNIMDGSQVERTGTKIRSERDRIVAARTGMMPRFVE